MANTTTLRKSDRPEAPVPAAVAADRVQPRAANESQASRLARARTANEIAKVIGLRPIKGRSGPKIAY